MIYIHANNPSKSLFILLLKSSIFFNAAAIVEICVLFYCRGTRACLPCTRIYANRILLLEITLYILFFRKKGIIGKRFFRFFKKLKNPLLTTLQKNVSYFVEKKSYLNSFFFFAFLPNFFF